MDSQPDRIPRAWHILACAALVILTVIFTWPLLAELSTSVIGPFRGDNFEYVWKMWWVPHALFERGISPFFNPDMAVPTGYALAYGEITPAHTFLYASITLLVGEIAAYNLTILASFILTGWFTYGLSLRLLARLDLTDVMRFTGALLASFAFTFCAYRMARIAGHLPLIDTQWLVLTFWALDRWLETRRISDALLIGLAVALAGLSTWYYLFMLGLIVPVYALTFPGRRAFRATFSGRKHGWEFWPPGNFAPY